MNLARWRILHVPGEIWAAYIHYAVLVCFIFYVQGYLSLGIIVRNDIMGSKKG